MEIKFHEVTWYSKLLAVVFLLGIFPMFVFWLGRHYEQVVNENVQIAVYSAIPSTDVPRPSTSLCDTQTNQQAMNDCAAEEFVKADAEMNNIYYQITSNEIFKSIIGKKIESSQKAWNEYVDNECNTEGYFYEGASVAPYVISKCKLELTVDRTRVLKSWLDTLKV